MKQLDSREYTKALKSYSMALTVKRQRRFFAAVQSRYTNTYITAHFRVCLSGARSEFPNRT